jgi:hypothetical protein
LIWIEKKERKKRNEEYLIKDNLMKEYKNVFVFSLVFDFCERKINIESDEKL